MVSPTTILIATIIVAAGLSALLIFKPSITVTRAGKILAFVSLFIFPLLATTGGVSEHVERSKTTQFCVSCHVMQDYGKSLHIDDASYLPASHFQNNRVPRDKACFTCHTDYTMYGDLNAKLRGLKHVYVQYLGKVPEEIKLYSAYNNRECLHCHAGARNFEEGVTHNEEKDRLGLIKTNQLSCMTSGCHDAAHNIKGIKDATFWFEVSKANKTDQEGNADGETDAKEKR